MPRPFFALQVIAAMVLFTANTLANSIPSAPIKTFICPSQQVQIASAEGVELVRFQMHVSSQRFGSHHPGGASFLFADDSTHFIQAEISLAPFTFDLEGNLTEIRLDIRDPVTNVTGFILILPYIEQDNLFRFMVTIEDSQVEFDAFGHLLPAEAGRPPSSKR